MKKIMVLLMISFTIVNATTIYDIQSGAVSEGESVTIQGIVTAANGETPDGDGSFYIQDGAVTTPLIVTSSPAIGESPDGSVVY